MGEDLRGPLPERIAEIIAGMLGDYQRQAMSTQLDPNLHDPTFFDYARSSARAWGEALVLDPDFRPDRTDDFIAVVGDTAQSLKVRGSLMVFSSPATWADASRRGLTQYSSAAVLLYKDDDLEVMLNPNARLADDQMYALAFLGQLTEPVFVPPRALPKEGQMVYVKARAAGASIDDALAVAKDSLHYVKKTKPTAKGATRSL